MKKILMFAPFFFEYEKRIKEKLEEKGYNVILYSDYTTYKEEFSFLEKFKMKILRKKKKILADRKEKYFSKIYEKEKANQYDYVFVIKGSAIPQSLYEKLKNINKKSVWIAYQWDDIVNCKEFLNKVSFFDKIFTYSQQDSKEYGFRHQPFFYSLDFNLKKTIDISFVGTEHSDRGNVLRKILQKYEGDNLNFDIQLIIDRAKYLRRFYWLKKYHQMYKFKTLSYEKSMNIFAKSKAIIEIPHPKQQSITTRSIEALGTKTKVITTTSDIKNQDFYMPENYLVIDRENPIVPQGWIESPYREIDPIIKEKYTLDSWIEEIFKE